MRTRHRSVTRPSLGLLSVALWSCTGATPGPETTPDPAGWRTQLFRPLVP